MAVNVKKLDPRSYGDVYAFDPHDWQALMSTVMCMRTLPSGKPCNMPEGHYGTCRRFVLAIAVVEVEPDPDQFTRPLKETIEVRKPKGTKQ
jgi:hypothetical protein